MVGGAISGYCETGKATRPSIPNVTIITESQWREQDDL